MSKPYTVAWKRIANKSTLHDIVVHAALKAFFAKPTNNISRDEIFRGQISKAFTPITNQKKLENSSWEFQNLSMSFNYLHSNLFHNKKEFPLFDMKHEDFLKEVFNDDEKAFNEFIDFFRNSLNVKLRYQYQFNFFEKRYYCYIFVKQEGYDPVYQAVQATHVAIMIGQNMPSHIDAEEVVFQVCKVKNDFELSQVDTYLNEKGFELEFFYERDVNDVIAFGIHPVPSYKRQPLLKYELLTF